ncbi:MAG TPA: hypothetical protein VGC65_02615 [Bacteroidia bacterium]|jgi:hypothetical protein
MFKHFLFLPFFFCTFVAPAQYDAECFINTKKEVRLAVESAIKQPGDSVYIKDSIFVNGVKRYIDTAMRVWHLEDDPYVKRFVGCRMPDFSFFTVQKNEMSVNSIRSDFTIINFSSTTYGDVSNARMHQLCKLKKRLNDSLTVLNIFADNDKQVLAYAANYEENVEFVANADLITYNYTFNGGAIIYVLDKYKNIIYVKSGHNYRDTPDEIYSELLELIRASNCSD